jgi:hypothetical protein
MISDDRGREYQLPGPFYTLDQIKREHKARGGHYFDPDTNRFFAARYSDDVIAGAIFVDSVRGPGMDREYRVKIIGSGRSIGTIREGFSTLAGAKAWAVKVCDEAGVLPHERSTPAPWAQREWGSVDQ